MFAARDGAAAVRRQGHAADLPDVPPEAADFFFRLGFPELDHAIGAAGKDLPAVARKHRAHDNKNKKEKIF
jgi:hypothetical protein